MSMLELVHLDHKYQKTIPNDLSKERYISGFPALNLQSPEGTSGDWHFLDNYYAIDEAGVREINFVAGTRGRVDTNHIFGDFGIYEAGDVLSSCGLVFNGVPYAANHFRAVLDVLFLYLSLSKRPISIHNAAYAFFDTQQQQMLLLTKAERLYDYCDDERYLILKRWLDIQWEQVKNDGY